MVLIRFLESMWVWNCSEWCHVGESEPLFLIKTHSNNVAEESAHLKALATVYWENLINIFFYLIAVTLMVNFIQHLQ